MPMIPEIRRELARLEMPAGTLRNFGLLFAALFGIAAVLVFRKGDALWYMPAAVSAAVLLPALFFPAVLQLPFRCWMLLAFILSWFTTRIVLTAAFLLIMTPTGWLLRLAGKDVLDERIERERASYWRKHEQITDWKRYTRQF